MIKVISTAIIIFIFMVLGANTALDDLLLMNTFPKKINQELYQDVAYVQQHCDALKISDFCRKNFNKITKLQIKEHGDMHFGTNSKSIIGITWTSPFTNLNHVFISTAVSWDENLRKTTMVHELGHVLYLGHYDDKDDIMNTYANEKINLTNLDGYTDLMLMRAYNESVSTK